MGIDLASLNDYSSNLTVVGFYAITFKEAIALLLDPGFKENELEHY